MFARGEKQDVGRGWCKASPQPRTTGNTRFSTPASPVIGRKKFSTRMDRGISLNVIINCVNNEIANYWN